MVSGLHKSYANVVLCIAPIISNFMHFPKWLAAMRDNKLEVKLSLHYKTINKLICHETLDSLIQF